MSDTRFFFELTPDKVLAAVESAGLRTTGRCLALNSFENRVYDVELEWEGEDKPPHPSFHHRIAKFYRPGRWSREQVLEEHRFVSELAEAEIPAIAPLAFEDGSTLQRMPESEIFFALFRKVGGRAPDELSLEQLVRIGRLLGRIHNVGATSRAPSRVRLGPDTYGRANLDFLLQGEWIPLEFRSRYRAAVEAILEKTTPWFQDVETHRLHGDCHLGNLLWSVEGPFFLDFDDMVSGPAVQDLWLLLPGRDEESRRRMEALLEGYEEMRRFDRSTLRLVEPLRALRYIHYTAWIARRWEDPAFPLAFPQFGSHRYWSDETQDMEGQLRMILQREQS
jgi:Ser/Thr protein kinase RdoA (MazF antagonist)